MKKIALISLVGAAMLLAGTAYARADFIITPLLFAGGMFATGTTTIAGLSLSTIATLAVTAASFAMSAFAKKPETDKIKNTITGSEGPGLYAFGRVEIEGRLLFGNTAGYYISRLAGHCFGVIDRVEQYFYDSREITVEADGYVSTPPWARPPDQPRPSYMNVQTKVGDGDETAWPSLISDFPTSWTADHRARGIGQTLMRIESPGTASSRFARLLQGGVKNIRIRARITRPYDPRISQNRWTLNSALIIRHFMLRLGALKPADIDDTVIGATATICEAIVPTLTGTAARSNLSGGWEGQITTEIVSDMMESAGIEEFTADGGKSALRLIEDWPDSEISLSARHIIELYPQAGPESGRRPNICKVHYFSPERRYERAEIDMTGIGWARIEDEIAAYGDQEMAIDLTFCCNASQAQRIARRMFYMARADTGVLKTSWAGMACWGKRAAMIEIPDVGEDGGSAWVRCQLGTVRPNDGDGTCEIPFQIIPDLLSVPFNPATDEALPPPVLLPQQAESDLETPAMPAAGCMVQYPVGGAKEFRVLYTRPAGGGLTPEVVYRVYDDEDVPRAPQSMTEIDAETPRNAWAAVDVAGEKVDVRARIFNADGDASFFSEPLVMAPVVVNNTAPGAPVVSVGAWVEPGIGGETKLQYTVQSLDIQAVRAVVELTDDNGATWAGFAIHDDIRPGANVSQTDLTPTVGTGFRARLYTSNLTPGTATGEAIYTS